MENLLTKLPPITSKQYREVADLQDHYHELQQNLQVTENKLRNYLGGLLGLTSVSVIEMKAEETTKMREKMKKGKKPQRFARGELSRLATVAIEAAGRTGISPKALAKELNCSVAHNIMPWYYGTGNKHGITRRPPGSANAGNFIIAK